MFFGGGSERRRIFCKEKRLTFRRSSGNRVRIAEIGYNVRGRGVYRFSCFCAQKSVRFEHLTGLEDKDVRYKTGISNES